MREAVLGIRQLLETLHLKTGDLLVMCSRTLAVVAALGTFFSLMMLGGLLMSRHPERIFQLESFQVNYVHSKRGQGHDQAAPLMDPSWDGAIAGFGLGVETGKLVPWVGPIVGPVAGALLGYQLDQRI
jgi:hypothetical protein